MTKTTYNFGTLNFTNIEELQRYCDELRLSCPPGHLVSGDDNDVLLRALINSSFKTKSRLKGHLIVGWTTKENTSGGQGLAAILDNDRIVSFGVTKLVKRYIELQESEF